MHALDDTARLLDLLREAGPEAVTLSELEVAGVREPARALFELELAGHAVSRVLDERVECVRLAPFDGARLVAEPSPARTSPRRPLLAVAALLLLALLLGSR